MEGAIPRTRPKLRLLHGGRYGETNSTSDQSIGPVTRLGLWDSFKPLSKKQIAFLFLPKLILLAALFYFLFGQA